MPCRRRRKETKKKKKKEGRNENEKGEGVEREKENGGLKGSTENHIKTLNGEVGEREKCPLNSENYSRQSEQSRPNDFSGT